MLTTIFADASFSSGTDSPWPLVAFIFGMVALYGIYAWQTKD